ncbi:hypothetical protein V6N12_035643 [Hibiscus sabdariffa]|uniref:Uncharacterized protein n=1 Tax=Hibiscus sabdariffa TaxID=183260 RepID=A0ABR2ENB1_9ROSI
MILASRISPLNHLWASTNRMSDLACVGGAASVLPDHATVGMIETMGVVSIFPDQATTGLTEIVGAASTFLDQATAGLTETDACG